MFNRIRATEVQLEVQPHETSKEEQETELEAWPLLGEYIRQYGVQTRIFDTTRQDN